MHSENAWLFLSSSVLGAITLRILRVYWTIPGCIFFLEGRGKLRHKLNLSHTDPSKHLPFCFHSKLEKESDFHRFYCTEESLTMVSEKVRHITFTNVFPWFQRLRRVCVYGYCLPGLDWLHFLKRVLLVEWLTFCPRLVTIIHWPWRAKVVRYLHYPSYVYNRN
jgi:hypothetical protein